jgi:hypothetical protein
MLLREREHAPVVLLLSLVVSPLPLHVLLLHDLVADHGFMLGLGLATLLDLHEPGTLRVTERLGLVPVVLHGYPLIFLTRK